MISFKCPYIKGQRHGPYNRSCIHVGSFKRQQASCTDPTTSSSRTGEERNNGPRSTTSLVKAAFETWRVHHTRQPMVLRILLGMCANGSLIRERKMYKTKTSRESANKAQTS
jgi:hypothetical protein